ncbi:hypothetical protein JG687_00010925 [Phytophthora cactorum]|uniref:tRNA pseudouridine(55) synthase n=1 Tax=Phytophthora cactorum TaxID=29920 RepID=A0A8T1U7R8_9STRA|nr:hypothetical protein JG687_00010925 [Phytophthora cactorum]
MDLLSALRGGLLSAKALLRAQELGVCVRCCLRFAGIEDSDVYTCAEEKLVDAVHEYITESGLEVEPQEVLGCTCCVGVLSGAFHEKILADVQQLTEKADYDVKAFSLNIKLPSVVLLREYSLLKFLRSNVDNFPRKVPFDMKDVLKSFLAPSVSRMLKNAECTNGSEFAVLIDIKHDESADEVRQIPAIKRMGESSVEECIGDIALPFFRGSGYKFHTAGREDVDVRMLGNGRPFILEILDAKKAYLIQSEYDQIQKAVNDANSGAVEIVQVKSSTKDYFAGLQAGADSKKKTYWFDFVLACVVWSEGVLTPEAIAKIDAIQDLTIQQQTPIRVLHRRTLMTRPKIIHAAKCEALNKHYMLLRLTTSAGTYVKEFVHGDRGRTNPNVASILGSDADIIQLDVESLIDAQ